MKLFYTSFSVIILMSIYSESEEKMSPKEWLQYIRQKKGLDKKFCIPRDSIKNFIKKLPKQNRKDAEKIWLSRYNQNISEVYDELMDTYLNQVKPILSKNELDSIKDTYFDIFPTFKVNARVGYTPRGDKIILLHEALGFTINYWSHWYLRSLDENRIDYLLLNPQSLEYALKYILSTWNGVYNYEATLPDIYPKTEDSWRISEELTLSAIVFVIGHEIGHIYYNHSPYTKNKIDNHKKEFEADLFGLKISIRFSLLKSSLLYTDTYYTKYMLFGPLFVLAIISLFGDSESQKHPSPSARCGNLLKNYIKLINEILGDKFDKFLKEIDKDLEDIL